MQQAHKVAISALSSASNKPSVIDETPKREMLSQDATDKLWLRMAARYGHSWVSQYGASPDRFAGAEWRLTLAGLTDEQIRVGFDNDRARGGDWPPSSTGFRAMCFGIPSFDSVAVQVTKRHGNWTPFVRLVWHNLDTYQFSRVDTATANRLLRAAYEVTREHVMRGGALPEPSPAIEAPKAKAHKPASDEVARAALDKIAAAIGGSEPWANPVAAITTPNLAEIEAGLVQHYGAASGEA